MSDLPVYKPIECDNLFPCAFNNNGEIIPFDEFEESVKDHPYLGSYANLQSYYNMMIKFHRYPDVSICSYDAFGCYEWHKKRVDDAHWEKFCNEKLKSVSVLFVCDACGHGFFPAFQTACAQVGYVAVSFCPKKYTCVNFKINRPDWRPSILSAVKIDGRYKKHDLGEVAIYEFK